MLSRCGSLDQEEPGFRGALWQAASGGYHVIVQLLLDNYPMPLDSYDCFMALCEAVKLGHIEVIKAFLEKFPRGRRWKFHLNVAACWAVTGMQPASIDILIRCLEDVEAMEPSSHDMCLLFKVLSGDEAIAKLFLEKGADANYSLGSDEILAIAERYQGGQDSAFYAVSLGHCSILRQLLKHSANKEERDEDGWSLLIAAVSMFADTTDSDMLELLLDEGADVEAKDKDGNTPLMHGAWCLTTAKLLLARGADVNARSKHGVTPLMKAAFYKENAGVVKLFLEHGADPTAKDEGGRTAASQAKDEAVLTLLREYSERS
ncbi:HET domain-containing protein [Fusarium sp. Ph1]|nr:HET domain-containing protein [Fusarium sp. Ph1]